MTGGETARLPQPVFWLVLCAAFVASAAALWWLSGSAVLVAAYIGALAVICALVLVLARMRHVAAQQDIAPPDWSVTVAAIERAGEAVAITDRANRLVCANGFYREQFGSQASPPNLPLGRGALESAGRAMREAWRDGEAAERELAGDAGAPAWRMSVQRVGRGSDHLVWRFVPAAPSDPGDAVSEMIAGEFGRLLGRAGIEAAVVSAEGVISAHAHEATAYAGTRYEVCGVAHRTAVARRGKGAAILFQRQADCLNSRHRENRKATRSQTQLAQLRTA